MVRNTYMTAAQPFATLESNLEQGEVMGLRNWYIRAGSTMAVISVIALVTGCAKTLVSGVFVDKVGATKVGMIQVVESPPGHLTGSMVMTALNRDGATKTNNYSVSGSINGSNVSLRLGGGLVGLARLFGTNTILIGSLRGQTLTLSIGNSTSVFHKVSNARYQGDLARLNITGRHIALVQRSTKALQDAVYYGHRINARLQQYITWGEARISRVPYVRAWYANRVNHYVMCLNYIKPLAATHVPEWRWQECALSIETDKYYRDQEISGLRNLRKQNQHSVAHFYTKLDSARAQFAYAIKMVRSSCPYRRADAGKCLAAVKQLQAMGPYGFINKAVLSGFRDLVPKVKSAVNDDILAGSAGEVRLSGIAQQVSQIYRSAFAQ